MARARRYSDLELTVAVMTSVTVADVMRALGIKPAGGSHFHLSKRIKRLGLDTSHFLGKSVRKGIRQPRLGAEEILIVRPADGPRAKPHMLRRALIETGLPHTCSSCGTSDQWMGKPLTLHVDHIDGDPANCLRDNLRFLCPNCHSQTATYCRQATART